MTDSNLLKSYMVKMGFTQKSLADALGLSIQTINMKINGERQFRPSEIIALKKLLHLTSAERDRIFFAEDVDE